MKRVASMSKREKLMLAEKLDLPTDALRVCGAKLRSPGKHGDYTCHAPVMENGRCRMHGGNSRAGAESARFKHGRYSHYVPESIREDYERIRSDGDLANLDDELSLLTVRIAGLLTKLESSAPPWETILVKWGEAAAKAGGSLGPEFDELRTLMCEGAAAAVEERAVWGELRELIQEKTRTASAEWSRLRDLQGLVKLDQVLAMLRGVLEAVRANVADPVLLKTIVADVLKFAPMPIEYVEGSANSDSIS